MWRFLADGIINFTFRRLFFKKNSQEAKHDAVSQGKVI
jgi:hypothetical protein